MRKVNAVAQEARKDSQYEVYSADDIAQVTAAILLTDPTGGWNGKTISVPGFAKAQLIAQVVELADLGGSGMEEPHTARYEALSLFPEENLDFREEVDKVLYGSGRSRGIMGDVDKQAWYKERFLAWINAQKSFVEGRSVVVEGEINSLRTSEKAKIAVLGLFSASNFKASLEELNSMEGDYKAISEFKDWASHLMDDLAFPPHYSSVA